MNSIITQLMAIEKQPLTNLQSAGSKIQTQISEVGKIKSALSTLNDAAAKLASSDFWKTTTGSSLVDGAVSIGHQQHASAAQLQRAGEQPGAGRRPSPPAAASSTATLVGTGTLTIEARPAANAPVAVTIDAPTTRWRRSATRSTRPAPA